MFGYLNVYFCANVIVKTTQRNVHSHSCGWLMPTLRVSLAKTNCSCCHFVNTFPHSRKIKSKPGRTRKSVLLVLRGEFQSGASIYCI